jgi:septal ring-binding cell division protein DamX
MEQPDPVNRADVLKRVVERGVAGEAEIGVVSRLLYVQLLSSLQRGLTVEIPGFGTFGTRVAGVKKIRKIPYFEPSPELAERANARFRDLKPLVIGTYERVPAFGDVEFRGTLPLPEQSGEVFEKEHLVDSRSDVSVQEFESLKEETQRPQPTQEDGVMPRLNLKDESAEGDSFQESESASAPPTLREVGGGGGGGGLSPVVLIILIIAVLGLGVFALNHFGVIHLWGKKAVQVTEAFPEPSLLEPALPEGGAQPGQTEAPAGTSEPAPAPTTAEPTPQITPPAQRPAPAAVAPAVAPPSGTGKYTIQVSSWASKAKAEAEAGRLGSAGLSAFVEEGMVGGTNWYRVRIGRYASEREAKEAIAKMQPGMETDLWVAHVGR